MPMSFMASPAESPEAETHRLSEVGRVGHLVLQYRRDGDTTILARSRCTSPWHCFPPMDLGGVAYTVLVNPSGGLVAGDRLTVEIEVGPSAQVLISTPSANRVYRSRGAVAMQSVHVHVGPGSIFEWLPDVTIPFAASRLSQCIRLRLEPGAAALVWDSLAAGRIARGERWCFSSFDNEIRIESASGRLLLERCHLGSPDGDLNGETLPDTMREWDYVGSLFIIAEGIFQDTWRLLEADIAETFERWPGHVLAGISEPAVGGRVVKMLARTGPYLQMALEGVWAHVRRRLWKRAPPALRRY